MKLVIIADPDEYVRSAVKSQLQRMNLEVIDVSDGLAVYETLKNILPVIPDCVISEIVMPRMNGYELLRTVHTKSHKFFVERNLWIEKHDGFSILPRIHNLIIIGP